MYQYSLETFVSHESVRDIVIVVPYGMVTATQQSLMSIKTSKSIFAVAGGKERWQSVQNGVLATDADWILVHDAARPFVTHAVIDGVIDKCIANDCVITATPEVDTIRALSGDFAGKIIDRSTLIRTGTPQLFRRAVLVEAFRSAASLPVPPTDEASLMQQSGVPVAIAWGDPANFKITTPSDLAIAEAIVAHRQ
jgi:2-C-methyl-D-erythritol 4-phosphate cytidylyltransferase